MPKELRPWAQDESGRFFAEYRDGNCSCHLSAPCGSCTHPGNPLNLECTEDAWGWPHEVAAEEALLNLKTAIDEIAARHLAEMQQAALLSDIDRQVQYINATVGDWHDRVEWNHRHPTLATIGYDSEGKGNSVTDSHKTLTRNYLKGVLHV